MGTEEMAGMGETVGIEYEVGESGLEKAEAQDVK
jgi:hypothetical protein